MKKYFTKKDFLNFLGLDLTGGRYDTPDHQLFSTLLDEHNNDFRNSNAKVVSPMQGMISFLAPRQ